MPLVGCVHPSLVQHRGSSLGPALSLHTLYPPWTKLPSQYPPRVSLVPGQGQPGWSSRVGVSSWLPGAGQPPQVATGVRHRAGRATLGALGSRPGSPVAALASL